MQDDDELLTPEMLAADLKVALATLADWRVRGGNATPPFVKIGKHVRYPRGSYRAWLAKRLRLSTSDPGPENRAA
jgi:predicted DNA-binding transcriptional regulator AlpA